MRLRQFHLCSFGFNGYFNLRTMNENIQVEHEHSKTMAPKEKILLNLSKHFKWMSHIGERKWLKMIEFQADSECVKFANGFNYCVNCMNIYAVAHDSQVSFLLYNFKKEPKRISSSLWSESKHCNAYTTVILLLRMVSPSFFFTPFFSFRSYSVQDSVNKCRVFSVRY